MVDDALPIEVTLTMLGDWHVGQGAGIPGSIDRLVVRHRGDDLPVIPGKTLRGVWRDACELVAQGLDGPAPGAVGRGPSWAQWVDVVFGDQPAQRRGGPFDKPWPGRLCVPPARYPAAVRDTLGAHSELRRELTFLKPGVCIDPKTGQAADDMLRFEEVVRGIKGLALHCDPAAWLDLDGLDKAAQEAACALLWAGALALERLGGKRRRGMGRCALRVEFGDNVLGKRSAEDWLKVLASAPTRLPGRRVIPVPVGHYGLSAGAPQATAAQAPQATAASWQELDLTLKLLTPVLVARQVAGNVVESLDYVPGGMLLGPVSRHLSRLLNRSLLPEIAAGRLLITHAYAEIRGRRGLPVPLALFYDKDKGGLPDGTVYNRFRDQDPDDAAQLKQHRGGYVGDFDVARSDGTRSDGARLPHYERGDGLTEPYTHNTVDDQPQRPTTDVGGVYTYQAIVGGTTLRARLRLDGRLASELQSAGLPADWHSRLPRLIQLGAAKKDDYGLATLTVTPAQPDPAPTLVGQELVVWLTSDLLMRGEGLAPSNRVEQIRALLEQRLNDGAKGAQDRVALTTGTNPAAFVRTNRTEGWIAAWQLPRPSYIGVAAGSCVRFGLSGAPANLADRLARVQLAGLGERRAEGFGQVMLNPALLAGALAGVGGARQDANTAAGAASAGAAAGPPLPAELDDLVKLAWHRRLRRRAALLAEDEGRRRALFRWEGGQSRKPSNSQLGALRGQVLRVRGAGDLAGLNAWVEGVGEGDRDHAKWPAGALAAVVGLFSDGNRVWEQLASAEPAGAEAPPAPLRDELRYEAARALVLLGIRTEVRRREDARRREEQRRGQERRVPGG